MWECTELMVLCCIVLYHIVLYCIIEDVWITITKKEEECAKRHHDFTVLLSDVVMYCVELLYWSDMKLGQYS